MMFAFLAAAAQTAAPTCSDRILDYAAWREAPDQIWDFRWPAGGAAALTMFGAEHRRDPEHPQFQRIAAAFAGAAPSLLFFEGPDRGVGDSAEETIRSRGESGYARFLAAAAGIPSRSIEPPPPQQIARLSAAYPIDQVMLFFTLREAARLRDREGLLGESLDQAVTNLLQRVQRLAPELGSPLPFADLAGLQAAAARYWPQRDWRTADSRWFDPLANDAETGGIFAAAINRADSMNRNRHMVEEIARAVRSGERVFVVVGRNHVPMQAPALACALAAGG